MDTTVRFNFIHVFGAAYTVILARKCGTAFLVEVRLPARRKKRSKKASCDPKLLDIAVLNNGRPGWVAFQHSPRVLNTGNN